MSHLHPLDLSKSILDPIHGLIRMTGEEVKVINHRIFQRLRKIKQNGMLHLVFPSATHTRFEHSIGALFVADSMLRSLFFNSLSAGTKGRIIPDPSQAKEGQAINPELALSNKELLFLYKVVRLAALAHDLGHGPLSHTFDDFAPPLEGILKMLSDDRLVALTTFAEVFKSYSESHSINKQFIRVPHEVMSCIFFALAWHDIDPTDRDTPQVVAAAILGSEAFNLVGKQFRPWVSLVHDIVASAPADADRMDYLERDSRSCGVSYGLFDRNRLLKSMLCYKSSETGQVQYRLGIKLSGVRAVENFIQARFELFVQVYYHKTNRAISAMLARISELASQEHYEIIHAKNLDELVEGYTQLGDELFLDVLRGKDGSESITNPSINKLASDIHDRLLWRRVFDFQEMGAKLPSSHPLNAGTTSQLPRPLEPSELVKTLKSQSPSTAVDIFLDKAPPKATKDLDTGAKLLQEGADGVYSAITGMTWTTASSIINTLKTEEEQLHRIYLRDHSPEKAKLLRRLALQIVSDHSKDSGNEKRP